MWEASRLVRIAAAALACLALARPAAALTVRALSLDELVARADRIVHARCLSVAPLASSATVPVVEITLGVEETLKGAAGEQLVIHQLGGQWNRVLPVCTPGDEVVLFLHAPSRIGLTSPVGMEQGYLRVLRAPTEPARVIGDAHVVAALSAASPSGSGAALRAGQPHDRSVPLDTALDVLRAKLGTAR
jgi:hypothetical protein